MMLLMNFFGHTDAHVYAFRYVRLFFFNSNIVGKYN